MRNFDPAAMRRDLARDEGKRLEAYQDTMGLWTIGVGHLLGEEKRMTKITLEESDALLDRDIFEAEQTLHRVFPNSVALVTLGDVRYRALINMAFNRGEGNMKKSTTITPALQTAIVAYPSDAAAWAKVSDAILASPWAKQIGKRAERLAHMLKYGTDPV